MRDPSERHNRQDRGNHAGTSAATASAATCSPIRRPSSRTNPCSAVSAIRAHSATQPSGRSATSTRTTSPASKAVASPTPNLAGASIVPCLTPVAGRAALPKPNGVIGLHNHRNVLLALVVAVEITGFTERQRTVSSQTQLDEWPNPNQMTLIKVDGTWVFRFFCGDCGARLSHGGPEKSDAQQAFETHIIDHEGPAKFKWGADGYYKGVR